MISREQESVHEPAEMQKRFGLLLLLAAIALLMLSGSQGAAQERETRFSVLYNFCSQPNCADGIGPNRVIRDEDGNLYGTTVVGGTSPQPGRAGSGVVFKLDRERKETVLYTFTGGADGGFPNGPLVRDEAGNLYGTAGGGGAYGAGVVFRLDPSGTETVLYSFCSQTHCADGEEPEGGVIRDEAGNLYGTASGGNSSSSCPFGCGVVFKLDPSGKETVLYRFSGGADGWAPRASLIRDEAGNLYGTTFEGGDLTSPCGGCGVVFRLDFSGKETVVYSFTGGADGGFPDAPLVRDAAGNLYGTTSGGGNLTAFLCSENFGCGVVFKLDRGGKETVLYTFTGGADGAFPGSLTLGDNDRWDPAGNLYGTASAGGDLSSLYCAQDPPIGCGVVFKLDRRGRETVLHAFEGPDGYPPGGLLKHHGSLYGVTAFGGPGVVANGGLAGAGLVFKVKLDDDDHDHESDR